MVQLDWDLLRGNLPLGGIYVKTGDFKTKFFISEKNCQKNMVLLEASYHQIYTPFGSLGQLNFGWKLKFENPFSVNPRKRLSQ